MKLASKLLLAASIFSASAAFADPEVAVTCVGGPRFAFYAFTNINDAYACAQNVARVSRACEANVKVGNCNVQNWGAVDAVNPAYCSCPGQQAIGTW